MPTPTKPEDDKSAEVTTKTFTVAKGRTITHDGSAAHAKGAHRDPTHYGPGEKIELPEHEGKRLQDLGFLLLDNGKSVLPTGGPKTEAGEEIEEPKDKNVAGRLSVTQV